MNLHNVLLEKDSERSVLTHQLADYEKEVLEADINQWCQETRELAHESQRRIERGRCSHKKHCCRVGITQFQRSATDCLR